MSTEQEDLQVTKLKKHMKLRDKTVERNEKKRKREGSEDLELTSPVKKHRSKLHTEPSTKRIPLSAAQQDAQTILPCYQQSSSLYLPLPPISQKHALEGLCAEHLSPLILTYYTPFHGVILSYCNARLSANPLSETTPVYAKAIDEYAASFVWVTADFLIFKPQIGDLIEGWVNLQNESNIGLLCLNFLNATIERRRLVKGWKWIAGGAKPSGKRKLKKAAKSASEDEDEDEDGDGEGGQEAEEHDVKDAQGFFQDRQGKMVEGLIRFRVRNVETSRSMDRETSFLNIEGTMLGDEEEEKLQEQEAMRIREKGKRQPRYAMAGALTNDYDGSIDLEQPVDDTSSLKHRAKY